MEKQIILVDTDIIIDHARKKSNKLNRYLKLQEKNKVILAVSAVTIFEYYSGSYLTDATLLEITDELFSNFLVYELTPSIAKLAAKINREQKLYRKIEAIDILIAATSIDKGALLLTKNKKHFKLIPHLKFA